MNKTLYTNGNIITLDPDCFQVEAVLVENGIVTGLGSKEELLREDREVRLFDLQGATLMPSFIDSHSHITALARTLGSVSLAGARDFDEIVNRIARFRSEQGLSGGEWISAFGYDHNTLMEKKHPTREVLDRAALDNPIVIAHASGHMGVMNSAALRAVGVYKDTPDPEGGVIGRTGGAPNGYLEETAFTDFSSQVPQPSLEQRKRQLLQAQNIYLEHGITTVQDGITKAPDWELLKSMAEAGELKVDTVCYVDLKDNRRLALEDPGYIRTYHNRLKIGGYKIFLDGSPQGRTAWLSKPYENAEDNYRGYGTYKAYQVQQLVHTSLGDHMQLLAHCNGDAAAEQLMEAFKQEQASSGLSAFSTRPVMIHAQLVRGDQLKQMAKLGMIASFFVAHTYYWGDVHIQNLGMERAKHISPTRTAIEQGVVYTFHQDTPVLPPDMLMTIWCAVMRTTRDGVVIGERERVSPLEALRAVTSNAAYQYFEEGSKGTIEPGKLADFVILDQNPLEVALKQIKEIQVLNTIKEDKVVYSKHQYH